MEGFWNSLAFNPSTTLTVDTKGFIVLLFLFWNSWNSFSKSLNNKNK